jgi:hypothetical protein
MSHTRTIDISGKKFGRWSVIRKDPESTTHFTKFFCKCDCGTLRSVNAAALKSGRSRSCGCAPKKGHGLTRTRTYNSWASMKCRVLSKKDEHYKWYGGRGIKICSFLKKSPTNLIQSIGERPANKTLDRIDVGGHYSCGICDECKNNSWTKNIRWATPREQLANRRPFVCRGKLFTPSEIYKNQ